MVQCIKLPARRKTFFVGILIVGTCFMINNIYNANSRLPKSEPQAIYPSLQNHLENHDMFEDYPPLNISKQQNEPYRILWFNPPNYVNVREKAKHVGFSSCEYSNCIMSFDKSHRPASDAIIFDARYMHEKDFKKRPRGQVWIAWVHECPMELNAVTHGKWKKSPWKNAYNWTMSYNPHNSDIYLPYGTFVKKQNVRRRDYEYIASKKMNSALAIISHCSTQAKRLEYVKELSKYFNVTLLGKCGQRWDCGRAHLPGDCFNILNTTYKYYLSFENAFCQKYFTEKLFDNYKYDTVLIARGGYVGEIKEVAPEGTYISADDFQSAKELADYLHSLSNKEYAKILEQKEMFESPGYRYVYGQAMCELCKRLNKQYEYRKNVPDIGTWAFGENRCRAPTDVHDITPVSKQQH
ncbi:Fucosyltransferase 4 [Mactra antiquata]